MNKKLAIILDPGHGADTKGKRSPDGRLLEYRWNRDFTRRLAAALMRRGLDVYVTVDEENDISLTERCNRANSLDGRLKNEGYDTVFISVHVNAAGSDGRWRDARGCTSWVYTNAGQRAKLLGSIYGRNIIDMGLSGNRYIPDCGYFKADFTVLKKTVMPAVLIEHCFQDNKEDVDFLLSDKGVERLIKLHENSIFNYVNTLY